MENKNIEELKNELKELIGSIKDEETLDNIYLFMNVVDILENNEKADFEYVKECLLKNKYINVSDDEIKEAMDKYNEAKSKVNC